MNNTTKTGRPLAYALGMALLASAMCTNALADNYSVKVKKVRSDVTTGDIVIQVKPGTSEKNFTGKARVMLSSNDLGTNRALATLLTAVSLNTDVIVDVPNPPSYGDIQAISSLSMVAP